MNKKIVWLPYDFDTALGINNEGSLVFDYNLEDTDHLSGGANVYNGQDSVVWNNLRDAFGRELAAMYRELRSDGEISYEKLEQMFENHQGKWPEAIFNEDAWFKYIDPLIEDGTGDYLPMLQGSKAEQRKWWLYNRFRYMDSKYNAGSALTDYIQLRAYSKANITITPYADVYPSVKFGSYLVSQRGARNTATTIVCPVSALNDTEIYIYSASQLASVGDLSPLKVGFADFSKAVKLQSLKLGDSDSQYTNANLKTLTLGNNVLLQTVDVRNCTALTTPVSLVGCSNIENVYFDGTSVTGVTLPNGGILKVLHLPSTITNLTIMNQPAITDLTVAGYSNIGTLRIENCPTVDTLSMLDVIPALTRLRLIGFLWSVDDYNDVEDIVDILDTMRGLDENGLNLDHAYESIDGTIDVDDTLSGDQIDAVNEHYPYIKITANAITATVTFMNGSTVERTQTVTITDMDAGADTTYGGTTPTKASSAQYSYTFAGWTTDPNGTTVDPDALNDIKRNRTVYAVYTATARTYTVRFYNGSTLLESDAGIAYGGSTTYDGSTPVGASGWEFSGWNPLPTNIQPSGSSDYYDCYAQFLAPAPEDTISDTWEEILQHVSLGDYATRYSVGDTKNLDLGSEGIVNMQIAAFDTDDKASGGKAAITWISEQLLKTSHRMNPARETIYSYDEGDSFRRGSETATTTGYNNWVAENRYTANNTAKITFSVTAVTTGTLRLSYIAGASSYNTTTLTVDGTSIAITYGSSAKTYDLSITNGTTYTIVFETTKLSSADTVQASIKLCNTSGSGSKASVDALVTQNSVTIDSCIVRSVSGYQNGTGGVGGWENSEMRSYLRETIVPKMPQTVSSAIVEVTKSQKAFNTSGSQITQQTTETVWIPSGSEVSGTSSKYIGLFQNTAANRIKHKVGIETGTTWWLRSANSLLNFDAVVNTGIMGSSAADGVTGIALSFCI